MPLSAAPFGGPGCYYVDGAEWQVGERYELIRVLGAGSHGTVCLAWDKTLKKQVALKRIGDALNSPDYAKRVLRELCILRRLGHIAEGIVHLEDVFLKPSATGKLLFRKGQLVPVSLDIYMSMEYADQGDLFNLRGQLMEAEVRRLMWQLLSALQQLHAMNVWHRDVKSANVLVELRDGCRTAKLADFGSARSAMDKEHANMAHHHTGCSGHGMHASDSLDDVQMRQQDLHAVPSVHGGFQQALTRVVCTPCYRAPEVVMSRGNYSSAMDMWSAGCVFGELLQRVAYLGKSATPNLQVAPVFAIQGLPLTPSEGDHFAGGPGSSTTRTELHTLFSVIGTPSWASIQDVPSPGWRHYLYRIPGRAPTLFRRFGDAGEPAVDLLSRLLCFDPARRCSAEEAMQHEFFGELATERTGEVRTEAQAAELRAQVSAMQASLRLQQEATAAKDQALAELRSRQRNSDSKPAAAGSSFGQGMVEPGKAVARTPGTAGAGRFAPPPPAASGHTTDMAVDGAPPHPTSSQVDGAHGGLHPAAAAPSGDPQQQSAGLHLAVSKLSTVDTDTSAAAADTTMATAAATPATAAAAASPVAMRHLHFWEIADPSHALSVLEAELSTVCHDVNGMERLREMLEREVEEHNQSRLAKARDQEAVTEARWQQATRPLTPPRVPFSAPAWHTSAASGQGAASRSDSPVGRGCFSAAGAASGRPFTWELPKLDPSNQAMQIDADLIGYERISHHADSEQATLDPNKHLRAGRHGEWAATALEVGPKAGPRWGVSLVPPGMEEASSDPAMMAIIRSQHAR